METGEKKTVAIVTLLSPSATSPLIGATFAQYYCTIVQLNRSPCKGEMSSDNETERVCNSLFTF